MASKIQNRNEQIGKIYALGILSLDPTHTQFELKEFQNKNRANRNNIEKTRLSIANLELQKADLIEQKNRLQDCRKFFAKIWS